MFTFFKNDTYVVTSKYLVSVLLDICYQVVIHVVCVLMQFISELVELITHLLVTTVEF